MKAKFLRIDGSTYPQIANAVMAPSFAKELTSLVKRERDAAYSAGAEREREAIAVLKVCVGLDSAADAARKLLIFRHENKPLPVGESSRAPEGSTKYENA